MTTLTAAAPPPASTHSLTEAALKALVADLLGGGTTVIAPTTAEPGLIEYGPIRQGSEAVLTGALPRRPLKEAFFPPSEPLFGYRLKQAEVELSEVPASFSPRVVLGARPCDAAALEILDRVMGWDYRDELWFGRRAATTILALACPGVDGSCFCTAVGLGPDNPRGADWFLTPVEGGYQVKVLGEKGARLAAAHARHLGEARPGAEAETFQRTGRELVQQNLKVQPARLRSWIESHFEDPLWKSVALRCHGCGACAFLCPTCHCFDIVDEAEGVDGGTRRRNWDTCQTCLFTLHGSGHNPRRDQGARYRQRVNHKFAIYPKRFGEVLCTGCGRCTRACAGGMDLLEVLGAIDHLAAAPPAAAAPSGGAR